MADIRPPGAVDVLKLLNNAVHSRRVFLVGSSQIDISQERAVAALRRYLEKNSLFALAIHGGEYVLSGLPISQETLDAIPNLLLYRQLELLQQPQLCLKSGFDEASLPSLLNLLAAKIEEIKKEGGGGEYIRARGLENFFPTADLSDELEKMARENAEAPTGGHFLDKLPIKQEFLDYLLGKNNSARRARQIGEILRQPDEGGKLVAGCLATAVNGLLNKRQLRESQFYNAIVRRALDLTPEDDHGELLRATAASLAEVLPARAVAICFAQEHTLVAGRRLWENLLHLTSLDVIGEIVGLLRGRLAQLRPRRDGDDLETRRFSQTLDDILASDRGKQYLGYEKTKTLLESGELERRKKRAQAGLAALGRGDLSLFDNEEMLSVLPWIGRKMAREGRQRDVGGILSRVMARIEQRQRPISPSLAHKLVEMVDDFRREKQGALLVLAAQPLAGCLAVLSDGPACASVARALAQVMQICWKGGRMDTGDAILRVFSQIRDGKIAKTATVKRSILQEVDSGVSREMLEHFFQTCLRNSDPGDAAMDMRLVMLGPVAGRFLIERLMHSENAAERLRIIDLLSRGLSYLPGIVLEKLADPMPWYGKRNLLKLLAENGDVSHLEPIFAFLRHDDLRVQREAFLCLYKISGRRRRDTLLRVLSTASESIRLQAIKALIPYADEETLNVARQIIDEREMYSPAARDELLIGVCQLLERCPPADSIGVLRDFLALRDTKGGRGIGEAVWFEAEKALKQQRKNLADHKKRQAQALGRRKIAQRHLARATPALPSARLAFSLSGDADERTIARLLAVGDAAAAERLFLETIGRLSQQGEIAGARRFRQWFGERQPENSSAMIKAGELIGAARDASVEKSHLEIWADFYDRLTTEEFTAFYQALVHRDYQDEEIIIQKGEERHCLFMINTGRVKVVQRGDEGDDTLLQSLDGGQLLGVGAFLDPAIWPAAAASVGVSNLSCLDLGQMSVWEERQPELEGKLRKLCDAFTSVDDALRKTGRERRRSTRYAAQAHVGMRLFDNAGRTLDVGHDGELIDVSDQGLSLRLHIGNRREARQLLGRDASFAVAAQAEHAPALVADGKIVAVRELQAQGGEALENSLHVSLNKPIGERRLMEIMKLRDILIDSPAPTLPSDH
ncbi:MAG: cyclic nucleotide-binding domain-containing protein [Desulfobulbaceae bacterium]|jgi:hypothetical protein|nr:cyclic nucleotide-binding domain-containing protein [Desulfobulbaceae bacterium]